MEIKGQYAAIQRDLKVHTRVVLGGLATLAVIFKLIEQLPMGL